MSKCLYGITAWGYVTGIPSQVSEFRSGITKKDILRLQTIHSKAVRLINYHDIYTPTKKLLKETKQLTINQLIAYHMLVQTYKISVSKMPEYHYERLFSENNEFRTRSENKSRIQAQYW